jgi:hypothetical protein
MSLNHTSISAVQVLMPSSQSLLEESSWIPLDLGRFVSSAHSELESRLRLKGKRPADWELPVSHVTRFPEVVLDIARQCDGVLSGASDCCAVFHVSCGLERGLHRAAVGSGGLKRNAPYMLCEHHSRATTLLIASNVGVTLPAAIRSKYLQTAGSAASSSSSIAFKSADKRSWYDTLQAPATLPVPPDALATTSVGMRADEVYLQNDRCGTNHIPPTLPDIATELLGLLPETVQCDPCVSSVLPRIAQVCASMPMTSHREVLRAVAKSLCVPATVSQLALGHLSAKHLVGSCVMNLATLASSKTGASATR